MTKRSVKVKYLTELCFGHRKRLVRELQAQPACGPDENPGHSQAGDHTLSGLGPKGRDYTSAKSWAETQVLAKLEAAEIELQNWVRCLPSFATHSRALISPRNWYCGSILSLISALTSCEAPGYWLKMSFPLEDLIGHEKMHENSLCSDGWHHSIITHTKVWGKSNWLVVELPW